MRNRRFYGLTGIVTVLSFGVGLSRNDPQTDVPFELHGHLIVVKGSIDGLEDLNLIIDPGASTTVISRDVGKHLGRKGQTKTVGTYGRAQHLQEVALREIRFLSSARYGR